MAKNTITISMHDEIQSTMQSVRKVVSAAFADSPGLARTISKKQKTAQVTFKVSKARDRANIEKQGKRKIIQQVFTKQAPQIEKVIKFALEAVVAGMVGIGSPNVKVFNRSLGTAKPPRDIEQEPFAKFILSKEGAGEVGLPDPRDSLRQLKAALLAAITVDVIVHGAGPVASFRFDQGRLLKLTPHPDRFEGGGSAPFFSWLSLVTGPDFLSGGTPGYGLVRMKDFQKELSSLSSRVTQFKGKAAQSRGLKRIEKLKGLFRASRSLNYAGDMAGLMLSVIPSSTGHGRSRAEALGGVTDQYRPSKRFNGFWDEYWLKTKAELVVWTRRVMRATARELLRGK